MSQLKCDRSSSRNEYECATGTGTHPYSLLGIILAIEAILITSFALISQNRQNAHQDQRAELYYEVNVKGLRTALISRSDLWLVRCKELLCNISQHNACHPWILGTLRRNK